MAEIPLPPPTWPDPGRPGQTKAYALTRKRMQFQKVREQVEALAAPRIPAIQKMGDRDNQQNAVDQLFEDIEFQLRKRNRFSECIPCLERGWSGP